MNVSVQGGTSGCVVATRLSEDPNCKVLLLERGPAITSWLSRVPLLVQDYRTATSPAYSWISEPLAYAANATNTLFTGKAFGGTSKINANLYHRSTPGEYNGWSEAGHKGWSWDDVKPYFAKSETSLSFPSDPARGTSGMKHSSQLLIVHFTSLTLSDIGKWKNRCPDIYFGYNHKSVTLNMLCYTVLTFLTRVIDACQTLNIPASPTLNVPESPAVCCGRVEVALTEKGLRQSTFDAFLPSQVSKIAFITALKRWHALPNNPRLLQKEEAISSYVAE
jgi:choline dehydrogenase